MSQDKIRFRFSRRINPATDLGRMANYIAALAINRNRSQSDILFDLICAKYLPLVLTDTASAESRIQAIQSIYFLEASIQEILTFHEMDDPRPQSAKAAHAVSLNRDAYSGESKLLLSDDDGDDDDGPDQNIQSTVNRMRL